VNSQKSKAADSKSHDEVEIRRLYKQMIDGWNNGSGNAFAAPFTDDSDFIGFDGTHMKGQWGAVMISFVDYAISSWSFLDCSIPFTGRSLVSKRPI
jgi:hypothetical protein